MPGGLLGRYLGPRSAGRRRRRNRRRRTRRKWRGRWRVSRARSRTPGRPGRRTGRGASRGAGRSADMEDQSRTALRVTDRDRLTVADIDRRHPIAIDEDAVRAPVDGHPLVAGKPQHNFWMLRRRRWGGRAVQGDVPPLAVAHRHIAARRKDVPYRSDQDGQREGERLGAHDRHLPSTLGRLSRSLLTKPCGVLRRRNSRAAGATPQPRLRAPGGRPVRARPVAVRSPRRGRPEPR